MKYTETLGWAVFADGHRLSGYTATEAEAIAYRDRLCAKYEEREARWNASQAPWRERERRIEDFFKSLQRHGNVHRIKGFTHFDQKQMNAMKMYEGKTKDDGT